MKNKNLLLFTLAVIGILLLFKTQFFGALVDKQASYDFGEGTPDSCGNLIGIVDHDDSGASPRTGERNVPLISSFITGSDYAATYPSCLTKSCLDNIEIETGRPKSVSYTINGYRINMVTQSTTGPNDRCVWHGSITYNGQLVKDLDGQFSKGYREGTIRVYLDDSGNEVTSSDDYAYYLYLGGGTTSSSGSTCYTVDANIKIMHPEDYPCFEGSTLRTEGSYRVYCEGAVLPTLSYREAGGMYGYDISTETTFIKAGNSLPCVPSREKPVTQRSEKFALSDGVGILKDTIEGEIITLNPGEEKELIMFVSLGRLTRNQSYELQISATASGEEAEVTNDYVWYKE